MGLELGESPVLENKFVNALVIEAVGMDEISEEGSKRC